jgi:hypothetical protein
MKRQGSGKDKLKNKGNTIFNNVNVNMDIEPW